MVADRATDLEVEGVEHGCVEAWLRCRLRGRLRCRLRGKVGEEAPDGLQAAGYQCVVAFAPAALGLDEPVVDEHAQVLADGRAADGQPVREVDHARGPTSEDAQDLASDGIGERPERVHDYW